MKTIYLVLLLMPLLITGSAWAQVSGSKAADAPDPPPKGPIGYLNSDIPEFETPQYPGRYYEAVVPATLDLAERARLAAHAITSMTNPLCDSEMYSGVGHMNDPPFMMHSSGGGTLHGKFMEVLPLMRTMCGSKENMDVEMEWIKTLFRMQGPDGLLYVSPEGRPWMLPPQFESASGYPGRNDGYNHVCLLSYSTARALAVMLMYAQKDPGGPWADAAAKLFSGYKKVIIEDGDMAHVYSTWTAPGKPVVKNENPFGEHLYLAGSQAWIAQYLTIYDRARNVPEASRLAEKIMNYNMFKVNFNEANGRFRFGGPEVGAGKIRGRCAHFHTHAMNILGCLYVAMQTDNKELLDRGLKAYEWGKSVSDTLVGFFPMVTYDEYAGAQTSETCEVADMVIAGLTLSKMGIDRWDDVDRWVRNQLAENQVTWTDWITDGRLDRSNVSISIPVGEYTTADVAQRSLGSFAGWPAPNDFVSSGDWGGGSKDPITLTVMNCCTGSGARGLFAVWRDIISYKDDELRVNLLLNRASKWADIESHIPYTGRVDVKVKQPVELSIRIPQWVKPEEVKVEVNGDLRKVGFQGRYAKVGKVNNDQTVVMTFPISERTEKRTIEGFDYTFIVRGNDVVHVDPPGRHCPLYQRGHYRTGDTLYKKVTRFVSEESYNWW
jgi:hypothetical protein